MQNQYDLSDSGHRKWCVRIANMGVAELARAGLIEASQIDLARRLLADEIFTRLSANDLPPPGRP